jgi:hypothetical protein
MIAEFDLAASRLFPWHRRTSPRCSRLQPCRLWPCLRRRFEWQVMTRADARCCLSLARDAQNDAQRGYLLGAAEAMAEVKR